jgi:1,2-diacylglycerol 3-beta-galactosyltransferase
MPQERYAADWIEQQEVGLAIPSFRMIAQAVETLIEPKNFARYCTNVAAIRNRAVFEVPHLLHEILMTHRASKSLSKVQN